MVAVNLCSLHENWPNQPLYFLPSDNQKNLVVSHSEGQGGGWGYSIFLKENLNCLLELLT